MASSMTRLREFLDDDALVMAVCVIALLAVIAMHCVDWLPNGRI